MKLNVVLDGATHKIHLAGLRPGHFQLELNGSLHEVDVEVLPGNVYSLIIDGKQYEMHLEEGQDGFDVELDGIRYPVEVVDPRKQASQGRSAGVGGPSLVKAPMPGKVLKLLVSEGSQVELGSGVAIIEAMKMQNELRAPRAGKVSKLFVAEGDTVEANARLLSIE